MFEGLPAGRSGSRNDVPVDLPDVHAAASRRRGVPAATGQLTAALANRQALPDVAFEDALNAAVTQNHLRAQPMSPEFVAQMSLDKSLKFYKSATPTPATSPSSSSAASTCRPSSRWSSATWAACPPSPQGNRARRGIRPPSTVVEKEITRGSTPRSQVGVIFTGPFQNNEKNRVTIRTMANTLAGNLQRVLREDLGGTYGVSVVPEFTKKPAEEYASRSRSPATRRERRIW